ncbi:TAXI family TRAP transporter solute-binding subunit [Yinghuangia seranimata]|uniref:TAXI family TRAP transporter solute-binding subunit n=1 Tax=Yinghuangia seranimata TaxID=408067 RepID=UPI00248C5B72|nr:TAXI family TRAP transporter solute-binding subunit [Yinghuangia seranimata]MDI2128627.1 TAXI family TRAP transporter solute-binding subunit [Yinghuangia seranimata]
MRQAQQQGTTPITVPVRRTRTVVVVVLVTALVLFAGGLWISSDDDAPYRGGPVSIATGVKTGVYNRYAQLLAPRLSADLSSKVTVDETGGSVENLERVIDQRDTLGIATADSVANLPADLRGQLRAIARLYDDYVQLVVLKDSPVQSVKDLKGLRVVIGPAGSGVELIARRILATQGMDAERDLVPVRLGIGDAASQLRDRQVDAFFWSGGLPTGAVTDLAGQAEVKFVPLGDIAKRLREQYGQVYREAVIPSDAYSGGVEVPTVAVPNLMVTRADTDTGLIRRVTGTVMGNREAIGSVVHAAQLVDPRTAIFTDPPLPLHDGARLWYRSAKP